MEKDYLFFCNHCGLPQVIPNFIVKTYFLNRFVKGFYCKNCNDFNAIGNLTREMIARNL
ncbi:MAG: hypothetical protein K0Q87_5470 [Neobacillus sp.]|nr:hypothetical protein [Neobacillus sp.]